MKERDLHNQGRAWAYKEYGEIDPQRGTGLIKICKMTMLAQYGEGGWPDWLICTKMKHVWFMELKNPDGKGECSDLQLQRHAELRALGFGVYVADNLTVIKSIFRTEMAKAKGGKITRDMVHASMAYGGKV